jgi:hypothetical protein
MIQSLAFGRKPSRNQKRQLTYEFQKWINTGGQFSPKELQCLTATFNAIRCFPLHSRFDSERCFFCPYLRPLAQVLLILSLLDPSC